MKDQEIITENFSLWLDQIRQVQKTGKAVDVPCGECTACCTSSYFILIKTHETGTAAKIPGELMFPAPGLPKGNMLLGFDEKGHCPMFADNKCLIYDYRPETCRTYDCRIFTATGLRAGDDKVRISRQASRWKFSFSENRDLKNFSAVKAAAKFINEYAGCFPAGFIPSNTPQQALIAIKIYDVFLDLIDDTGKDVHLNPDDELIKAIIDAYERFEKKPE
jgi:uncharacterized protein